jgi:copper(I)-binding protein
MLRILQFLMIVAFAMSSAPSESHEIKADQLIIVHPWIKQSDDQSTANSCMKITNKGQVDDRLVSAIIGHGILFQLLDVTGSGTASVRTIVIPAGQTIQLHARSSHIAVISNSSPFFEGSAVPGTLTLERTGPIAIDFEIGG